MEEDGRASMIKIGVVSDTHIKNEPVELPGELLAGLEDVDLIVHAGDIACDGVLQLLSRLAPVEAVYGNVDPVGLSRRLEEKLLLEREGRKIGVIHGFQLRGQIYNARYKFPEADIIIFGHTHRPCRRMVGDTLFFNPGSPTDKRLQSRHSYGIIILDDKIKGEIIKF